MDAHIDGLERRLVMSGKERLRKLGLAREVDEKDDEPTRWIGEQSSRAHDPLSSSLLPDPCCIGHIENVAVGDDWDLPLGAASSKRNRWEVDGVTRGRLQTGSPVHREDIGARCKNVRDQLFCSS